VLAELRGDASFNLPIRGAYAFLSLPATTIYVTGIVMDRRALMVVVCRLPC